MRRVGVVLVVVAARAAGVGAQPPPQSDPAPPQDPPASAETDDDTIDPSQVPVDPPPPPPRYPRALVERPLMLPDGFAEGGVAVRVGQDTLGDRSIVYGTIRFGGAIAIGAVHPYGGISLLPLYSESPTMDELDLPLVTQIYAGTRLRITSDTSVGVQAVLGNVDSEYRRYSPTVFARHKFRPSDRTAIVVGGGVDYNRQRDAFFLTHRVAAFADADVELQVAPLVAVVVGGGVTQFTFVGDTPTLYKPFRSYDGGVGLAISVGERVDLSPSISYQSYGAVDTWSGGLGLSVR